MIALAWSVADGFFAACRSQQSSHFSAFHARFVAVDATILQPTLKSPCS